MSVQKPHKIWIEQCEAARTIRTRYGLKAAFDYLVGEKLINFVGAASEHPDFARELPGFISEVRRMFTPDEIETQLAEIERQRSQRDADPAEEDDPLAESPITTAEHVGQFMTVKELLTATTLGTS